MMISDDYSRNNKFIMEEENIVPETPAEVAAEEVAVEAAEVAEEAAEVAEEAAEDAVDAAQEAESI